jgi:putative nucleotidyltransferase-like protein
MSAGGLPPALRVLAARNLTVDRLTAEIAGAFTAEKIESLVLKGPALADWLYSGEVRHYGDSDLMVLPEDWQPAVGVLERLGFQNYLEPMAHPRMESFAGTAFLRGEDNLDLHCTLHGLEGSPELIVSSLMAGAERQVIAGAELRVPSRAALALHVALHAAHHSEGRPIEDLRRAVAIADERLWQEALAQARAFDGVPAFASGLRLLPEGVELTRRLGIEDVRSPLHELRRRGIPTAEGIDALLSPGIGTGQRLSTIGVELFPSSEFMRWWTPLARRGRVGLAVAYVWRAIWLLLMAPRAIVTLWRVRRASSD